MESKEIDRLFLRVAQGESAAVEPAFVALRPIVLRYCLRLLIDVQDAEDATQSSLIKMFEQAPSYDSHRSAVGWALAISYFECRTIRKRRSRRREVPEGEMVGLHESTPEEEIGKDQWGRVAARLVSDLPADDCALLLGREEELSRELLHLAPSARRKRKQRLMGRLRAAFREIVTPWDSQRRAGS